MSSRLRAYFSAVAFALLFVGAAQAAEEIVKSPDGQVQLKLNQQDGRLTVRVTFRGRSALDASNVQMIVDGVDLSQGATIGKPEPFTLNEKYPWRGAHSEAVNHYNGVTIPMKHGQTAYTLEVRVFNDAAAFRHVIPGSDKARIPDEGTTLMVPAGSTVWHHDLEGHYEATYDKTPVTEIAAGQWVGPPMMFKLPDGAGYAAITEAALVNYAGMALEADGKRGFKVGLGHRHPISHPYRLRYRPEDIERVSKPAELAGTITTPWRVVLVGADLNAMVNSDAIPNLNPPPDKTLFPKGIHTDWIKPGRAVWDYLDRGEVAAGAAPGGAPGAGGGAPAQGGGAPAQGGDNPPAAGGAPGGGAPGGGGRRSPEEALKRMKEFTKLAGELGFEHNIMEGFWSGWTDDQIREMVKYANEQNVKIWFWRSAGGRRNFGQNRPAGQNPAGQNPAPGAAGPGAPAAGTPVASAPGQAPAAGAPAPAAQNPAGGNQGGNPAGGGGQRAPGPQSAYTAQPLSDAPARRAFLKHLHELGVSGIKIDFLDHEAKEVIDVYQGILKEAAENKLMVDFHGANKPTGESRTWPNEMTREAVRGMETRRLTDRATHEVNLPFTRGLAGHTEYTPVHFGERRGNTTWAHQVASAAIITAPVLTYSASPATILANPAVEMMKSIPAVWDQTIVLPPSEIGEVALFARRSGDDWFLAAINNPDAKTVQVPLNFLGAGKYDALLVRDTLDDPASLKVEKSSVGQGDTMKLDLQPGGGFIGRFTKAAK